jgi:hypothetical protein
MITGVSLKVGLKTEQKFENPGSWCAIRFLLRWSLFVGAGMFSDIGVGR